MKAPESIEKFLKKFYISEQVFLKSDPERDRKVIEDALSIYRRIISKRQEVAKRNTLRIILESKMIKLATITITVLLISLFLITIMTKHPSTEMDTSPDYILSDVQSTKSNLQEMESCNILPVIPN